GAYTYSWSPSGGTGANASTLAAGSYICTITDANGCSITSGVTLTQPPVISLITSSVNANCGTANGQTSVTASGGTGAFTYSWAPSGGNAATATGLTAGSYTVTVTDANGCIKTATVSVSNSSGPVAVISSTTNASCNGGSNGSATTTVTGGTLNYTYSWSPAGGTAATATGLSIGTYTVQVTDANGCLTSATATITQPSAVAATNTHVDATCNGLPDGFASVTASGGTGAYTYSWSPSGGTGATASGLAAGTYTCTVTDANGCTTTTVVTIGQPPLLTTTATQVNELCNGASTGSATVTPSGGTGAYTYSWTPVGGTTATASTLAAGSYTCTIKDANGCSLPYTITITQPVALTATTSSTPSSCGNANGSVTATPSGGAGSYTFSWSPGGATTSTVPNLLAGTYTCLITDANGCTVTVTSTFNNQNSPKVNSTTTSNVTCFGLCNGSITVNASGGTGTLTYSWSPSGGTGATASALCPGTYTCTVTDANGCSITTVKTITQPTVLTSSILSSSNITCNGLHNGSANATASGGTGILTYSWSPSGGTASSATGLGAGLYTLTVRDSNACLVKDTVTLFQPTPLVVNTAGLKTSCFGSCTGTLITIPSGGTSPYTFSWTTGCTSASCNNVCAGLYTVTVTDKQGCIGTDTASVSQPPALVLNMFTKPANCLHADGMDSVSASGGTPGYTYSWSPGAGSTTSAYHNIPPGSYVVTVHDANNCLSKDSITVGNTPGVVASVLSTTNPSCFGGSNGKALGGGTGGTLPYTYVWSPAGGNLDTGKNLAAGSYTVTVTDAHGCNSTAVATIGQPSAVTAAAMAPTTLCVGQCQPLTASASGGTPGYSYTWTLNGFPATSPACPVVTSIYTVTCTDANGCVSAPSTVKLTVNPPLAVMATGDSSRCPGGSVHLNAIATGGDGNYSYTWSTVLGLNNSGIPNPIATPGSTTIYTVTVSDACGTPVATATDTVKIFPQTIVLFDAADTVGCAPLCITFSQLSNPACASAVWTFGDGSTGTGCNNVPHCYTTPGLYSVTATVKDVNGCKGSLTRNNYIDVHPLPVAAFSESPQPTTIVNPLISFTDLSTNAVTWAWNFGDLSGAHSNLQYPSYTYPDTGCYNATLTVTNIFGCRDSVAHEVCIHPDFAFWVPDAFTPNGDGKNDGWTPKGVGVDPDKYHLMIFDRWGNLIFETKIWGQAWDGRANNGDNIAQIDAYVWQINVSDFVGLAHSLRGVLFLIK
ncbi:MAG TPA: PKD domain-containing protein, partial [Bacteroidia bacterium]|nr:PKD domain-containing protein [Bacteroidia bacterium]